MTIELRISICVSGLSLIVTGLPSVNAQASRSPSVSAPHTQVDRQQRADWIRANDPRVAVDGYIGESIEDWPIRVSLALVAQHPDELDRARQLLAKQLQQIRKVVPIGAVRRLQTVPIWLSSPYPGIRPTGEYHPGTGWLLRQGRPPELHRCVELTNVLTLDREIKRMPMLLIHELAHAYHDQVLGFEHPEIRQAYQRSLDNGSYDSVQRSNGRTERAYAMVSPMEYFAESSEAWFGKNDFFPFNRSQLERHDPQMASLLNRLWNIGSGDKR